MTENIIEIYSLIDFSDQEFNYKPTTTLGDLLEKSKKPQNIGVFLTYNTDFTNPEKIEKEKNMEKEKPQETENDEDRKKERGQENEIENEKAKVKKKRKRKPKRKRKRKENQKEKEKEKEKKKKKKKKKKEEEEEKEGEKETKNQRQESKRVIKLNSLNLNCKKEGSDLKRSGSSLERNTNYELVTNSELDSKAMHLTESKEFEKKKTDTRKNKKIHLLSNIRNITQNGNRIERMSSFLMSNFVPKSDFKGKFLKPSTKIIKYAKSKLQFRPLPQKEIEIEIISHLPKFKSNIKSFSTNYSLDHIFDYYQSKDSLISSEEFGIVITKQDNFKKDIFKIIPNNELSKKEIQKNFLENSHRFGVWAKPNKKYCLGGYLSKLGNKYDTVQFGRKPSFVTVFLPDQRKIEILVDFNCKVKLIIQKLVDQFSLKTQTIKNEISHEVKYLLFHIEYANENGKLIESQLIKINQEQSLEFQGIYQFTSIKMIKINVPAPKKNNIHNASSKTNIWKEFRQNHQNLTWWKRENNSSSTSIISKHNDFLFNRISGISLNKLIELVTSAGYQTEEFIEIFLELLPSYSNESILLDRLIERFDVPSLHPKTQRTFLEEEKLDIQILTLNLIIKLIENKQHFLPVKVKTKLKTFIQSELINNFKNKDENNKNKNSEKPNYEKNQTINKYIKKIDILLQNNSTNKTIYTNQQKFRNSSLKIKKKTKVRKLSQINLDKINFQNVNVTQLAKQISLNTHDIFSKITSRELFNKAWTRRDKNEKAPNLTKLINKFNFYADWASTAILEEKTNSKKRLEIYEKMILLAHQFYKLNNFQDMFAILSGLQSAPVSRLFNMKRDLSKKCIKKYNTLLKLTDVTNGCKNLREHTAKSSLPAMPYVGIITTDLTHIHELPDFVDNNLFNWRKRMRIYEVIVYLRKFKQVGYNFIYISAIHNFLEKQKILDEDSMWDISFEIKPHPMDL